MMFAVSVAGRRLAMEHHLREAMTGAFTLEQRAALAARQADQDRTVEAMAHLNAALIAAASGREAVWRRNVADALETLYEAVTAESCAQGRADSLLSDIARTQPRLRNRVRRLRLDYVRLSARIELASRTLGERREVGIAETRSQVGDLLSALQLARGCESDLIYEAYFDAFDRDIEEELWGGADRDLAGERV
jgi:hypothetical protein